MENSTDSDGDILPAPIPRPYLDGGFGGLASPALMARRLPQLRRIRNLYRDGYKITQIFPLDKWENTQKAMCFPILGQTGRGYRKNKENRDMPLIFLIEASIMRLNIN